MDPGTKHDAPYHGGVQSINSREFILPAYDLFQTQLIHKLLGKTYIRKNAS